MIKMFRSTNIFTYVTEMDLIFIVQPTAIPANICYLLFYCNRTMAQVTKLAGKQILQLVIKIT